MLENKETHPSYGTVMFNRAQTPGVTLFGSNIKHDNIITMNVYHASISRELHQDHIFNEAPILSVEMSYAQFAEAISSFGMMPGVPCTIKATEKDGYIKERPEYKNQRKEMDKDLKKQMDNISKATNDSYDKVKNILSKKGTVTKADKEEILSIIGEITRLMPNTEFLYKRMTEEMDKTVLEAKNEIEAFTQRRLESIAKDAITNSKDPVKKLVEFE